MKKFDSIKIDTAIKYVERIAEGCNPVNNNPLEDNDVLNNPNIIRCMYFIKDVLEEVQRNDGIVGGKGMTAETVPFPTEILDEFEYKEDQSITHVLNQIFEPVAELNVKKISVMKIVALLKEEGFLLEETNPETGKTMKVPSIKGKELGIYMVEREYNGRTYQSVTYNKNAQEYIVARIKRLMEEGR